MACRDDELQQAMAALVGRYGVDRCQKALDTATLSVVPKVATTKVVSHFTLDLSSPLASHTADLIKCILFPAISVRISVSFWHEDGNYGRIVPILAVMEEYYDFLLQQHGTIDSLATIRREESLFRTLYLYAGQTHTIRRVLEREKCVAIFDKVVINHIDPDDPPAMIGDDVLNRIVDLVVNRRAISSLTVFGCYLRLDQALQLAQLLVTNQLEELELSFVQIGSPNVAPFGQALTQSLRNHVEMFADRSMLKVLNLRDALERMDADHHRDLFAAIGTLPSLVSFEILILDANLLVVLAGSIENWKIRRFKLHCEFGDEIETANFRPLFDSVASSRHIKVFSFGVITPGDTFLPEAVARQLFELALSPTSGLLDFDLFGALVDLRQLSVLVPDDVDPALAARRPLRRFDFVQNQMQSMVENVGHDDAPLANIHALVMLLSKQLPYLHSIGLTIDDWSRYQDQFVQSKSPNLLSVWNQLLIQIEKNHVGMALFEPTTLSTVPAGLWAVVLHRAVMYDEDPNELPWIGIYHMVQELLGGGYTGWNAGEKKHNTMATT